MALEKTIEIGGEKYSFLFNYKALLKGDEILSKECKRLGLSDITDLESFNFTACQLLGGLQEKEISPETFCDILLDMKQEDCDELIDFFTKALFKKQQISGYRFQKLKESINENSAIIEGLNGLK